MTHDFTSTMNNAWPWCEHCGRDRDDHEVTDMTSNYQGKSDETGGVQ